MSKRRPSGDGMVRKKDDGRWEGRIVIGHKENGDSIFRYIYAPTQKELTAKLRQEIIAYQGVDLTEDSKLTLNEWMDYWLDAIMAGTIRPSTLNGYRRYADLYIKPYLGDKQISKITPTDVQKMYEVLKARGRVKEHAQYGHQLSGSMVHSIHTMFHEAMKAAKESHIIAKNPTENIPVPKANPKPKQILNDDQLEQFMEAIKHDAVWHDFFYTELTTGLRRGELCGLMWADFDEAAGTLAVRRTIHTEKGGRLVAGATKTGRGTRNILLPASTAQLLSERKKHSWSEWIFPNPLKPESPTNPRSAYGHLKALLDSAGLPNIRFHDLRHPYVKHTTKIFSLRLMDFQAQAYPDARRKTRGACQPLRVGQSRSPVRPLCNRKRFSCLPPQSKMSWILYAISMRLSGYTSTRSISSSASSVVSVSASKIALDASLRLSCRACSSCFFFACANTAA